MLLFRSSVFVYIFTLFTLFNSKWTKMSIAEVLITRHSTQEGYNIISKAYKNVKAVQVNIKNFSKFFSHADTGEANQKISRHYFETFTIVKNFFSKTIYCFVKSYLHLLQLF